MRKLQVVKQKWAVGIDPSLTGFAVCAYAPGAANVKTARFVSKLKGVQRLADIALFLEDWLSAFNVAEVCLEGYSFGAKNQREAMGELGAAVKMTLYGLLGDPIGFPSIVPPTTLKKYVTGNGNAKKDQMMMAVMKKWGYEAANSDAADAYALARVGACMLGTDQPTLAYETDVLARIQRWTERPPQNHN